MIKVFYYIWLAHRFVNIAAYSHPFFTLTNYTYSFFGVNCPRDVTQSSRANDHNIHHMLSASHPRFKGPSFMNEKLLLNSQTMSPEGEGHFDNTKISISTTEADPMDVFQKVLHQFVFGPKMDSSDGSKSLVEENLAINKTQLKLINTSALNEDPLVHYPAGNIMRAELFNNKASVHFPITEYLHRGHCRLNVTADLMQTAINAFSILTEGDVADVLNLPPDYVLGSARTIAMLKMSQEKYAATWTVVKNRQSTAEIPHSTLELYRPLFKYINGREMARLNLLDDRILTFIGTHPDLDRHQMGVVASKYMQLNPSWSQPKYLNLMNNLLCGVPMGFMRRVPSNVYLQLTHQVFYHTRACDPLQRRFYLAMMTRTEALGKSYSWSARDVSRLGLLLAEVDGSDLAAINPESMSGITAQVMLQMQPQNLQHITEVQLRYLGLKPLNILARKLKAFQDQVNSMSKGSIPLASYSTLWTAVMTINIMRTFKFKLM